MKLKLANLSGDSHLVSLPERTKLFIKTHLVRVVAIFSHLLFKAKKKKKNQNPGQLITPEGMLFVGMYRNVIWTYPTLTMFY